MEPFDLNLWERVLARDRATARALDELGPSPIVEI